MFLLNNTTPGILTVVIMGVSIVFVGLIAIVIVCKVMSAIVNSSSKKENPATTANTATTPSPIVSQNPIENKGEVVAAISAAVAESLGKEVSAIRIHSIKRI